MSGLPPYPYTYILNIRNNGSRKQGGLFTRWFYAKEAGEANAIAFTLYRLNSPKFRNLRKKSK